MIRIDIQNPLGYFGTHQDRIAREILGLNVLGNLNVNGAQTGVTWAPFFPTGYSLTGIGTGLSAAGIALTGGHLDGFDLFDTGLGATSADLSDFDRSATWLQARIDAVNAERIANGETFDWAVGELVDDIFGLRRQHIVGSGGDDVMEGGRNADLLEGKGGNDTIVATPGNDTIRGGTGLDVIDYSGLPKFGGLTGDLSANTVMIGAGIQSVTGAESFILTGKADSFSGNWFNNTIDGGAGADTISGYGNDDLIHGGNGNDRLSGNAGNDRIFGDSGRDTIYGNAGNDELFGGTGNDSIMGGTGFDFISGGNGADFIYGDNGKDTMLGDAGIDFIYGNDGNDSIFGGTGGDFIYGGDGNDSIFGGAGFDVLFGASGKDLLRGGAGVDILVGQLGDDRMFGGSGEDRLNGGGANDRMSGGGDADTFFFAAGFFQGNDTITDLTIGDEITLAKQLIGGVLTAQSAAGAVITYDQGTITLDFIDHTLLSITQAGSDVLIYL